MGSSSADRGERPEGHTPRRRPLLPIFAGLAGGIAWDSACEPAVTFWLLLAGALVLLSALGLLLRAKPWANCVLALALMFALGGGWHCVRVRDRPPWHVSRLLGRQQRRYMVRAVVSREPEPWAGIDASEAATPRYGGWRYHAETKALCANGRDWVRAEGGLTLLGTGGAPDVLVGDEVQFLANVRPNRAPTNPGEPDLAGVYARQGSFGVAMLASADGLQRLHRAPWYSSPRVALGRLRAHLKARLMWRTDRAIDPLAAALVFGERGGLSAHQRDLLAEGGSVHFLAISGLHVGLFAAFVWTVLLWAGVPVRVRSAALIGLIWLYVLFVGGRVSASRAAWMFTFMAAAPLLHRRRDLTSALLGAGVVILLVRPQELLTPGFQLTFVAVWAIVYLYGRVAGLFWPWEVVVRRLEQPAERSVAEDLKYYAGHYLLLSSCVWVAVAPLSAYHFHHWSLLTPVINLVLWPLALLLIVGAFLLAPTALVGGAFAAPLVWLTGQLGARIQEVVGLASHLPGFVSYVPRPPLWWLGSLYAVLMGWAVLRERRWARIALVFGVLFLAASYLWVEARGHVRDSLTVTVADVGHGQCIAFRLPHGTVMLYDAGASASNRAAAAAGILWHGRARQIQALTISHRDRDHCNFVPYLARRFRIAKLLMPPRAAHEVRTKLDEQLRASARSYVPLMERATLSAEGLRCTALHPNDRFLAEPTIGENDRSLVLMCEFRGWKILLTGDLRQKGLQRLATEYEGRLRADVVVLPHHGVWARGLRALMEAARPAVAVVSSGSEPDRRTAALADELGASLWDTAREGAVIMDLGPDQLVLSGYSSGRRERLTRSRGGPRSPAGSTQNAEGLRP